MKVGLFDSGLGGLTVVKSVLEELKGIDLIYVADTKNAPYGDKSKDEILDFSIAIVDFLIKEYAIDALVVACNTATSAAIEDIRKHYKHLAIVGLEPGIKPAVAWSVSKKVGILATPATLGGEKYKKLAARLSQECDVIIYEQACPGLVEQIEAGQSDAPKTIGMLEDWLAPMRELDVDTIVLGCTHYPLIAQSIQKVMGREVNLVETSKPVAKRLLHLLEQKGYQNIGSNTLEILTTGVISEDMIAHILGEKYQIKKLDLTRA